MYFERHLNRDSFFEEISEGFPVAKGGSVKERLFNEIVESENNVRRRLIIDNPFAEDHDILKKAEYQLRKNIYDIESIYDDFIKYQNFIKKTDSSIFKELDLWYKEIDVIKNRSKFVKNLSTTHIRKKQKSKNIEIEKLEEDKKILRTRLQRNWRKILDKKIIQWELDTIMKYRKQLLQKLRGWLELLQKLANLFNNLSIEPGLLFDLSKDNLSLNDIEQIKRWADYISQDNEVKNLCNLLGRLRREEKYKRQELVKIVSSVTEYMPDFNSKEEIVGVCLGQDIEHVIPQEKALLVDEETSLLFDIKFIEGRLMCFDMVGLQANIKDIEKETMIEVSEDKKLGPIIVCVDTSGSMSGSPEVIAKAITLFMATRAISQKRNIFLINFSTGIETMDLSGHIGIAKVIAFLRRSFHGGTDVAPAFDHALGMMNREKYKESDLLVISDFMMADLPKDLYEKILIAKKSGNKFYSLCIGDFFLTQRLKETFDDEWIYNPNTGKIDAMHGMLQNVGYRN